MTHRRADSRATVGLTTAILLLVAPLLLAAQSRRDLQTAALLALAGAGVGAGAVCAAARLVGRRRPASPLAVAFGATAAVLMVWLRARTNGGTFALTVPVASAAAEGLGVWLAWRSICRLCRPRHRTALAESAVILAVVILGPVILAASTLADHNLRDFDLEPYVLYWTVGSVLLVAPLVALTTLPGDWFERWWTAAASRVMALSSQQFGLAVAVVTLALAVWFAVYCFELRPTTSDEIAQLFHARILLSGRLALPPDPNPEFFAIDNLIGRPWWMSQYPIGGPAVLATGVAAGAGWLVNPVLTALTAVNVYRFAARAYDEATARAATLLFAASPMVLMMGGSHMNHTPAAFLVTLALAALPAWLDPRDATPRRRAAITIGLSLGAATMVRPLDAVLAGVSIGIVMLAAARRERVRATSILLALAATLVPVALLLTANWRTTGDPLRFGYEVLWGPNHSLGLHDDPTGTPHTPWRALLLAIRYVFLLDWTLTAWPVPVLLIVALGLLRADRLRRWDHLLLAMFGAQLVGYALYWHDGQFAGPRFLFTAVPAVLVLAARAPFLIAERERGTAWRAAVVLIPACVFVSWLRPMPPFGVRGIAVEFREARRGLKRLAPPDSVLARLPRALVFVQEGAAARLTRRLWGLGVSRQDAARLLAGADNCTLLDAVRTEEVRATTDSAGRLARIERSARQLDPAVGIVAPGADPAFRVSAGARLSPVCESELARDERVGNTISYGPLLLENRFDALGRVAGPVVYVMDLSERNDVLRARFGDRRWFRYEIPRGQPDSAARLVPY